MTSTMQWLHYKLGVPFAEQDGGDPLSAGGADDTEADLIARQKALATMPLSVTFTSR